MMGCVVSLNPKPGKTVFTLDDGTGCVECVVWMGMDETGTAGGGGRTELWAPTRSGWTRMDCGSGRWCGYRGG